MITLLFNSDGKYPGNYMVGSIYAHGELENDLNNDLIGIPIKGWNSKKKEYELEFVDGIYDVEVLVDGDIRHQCKFYYWKLASHFKHRGLVVLNDDVNGNTEALKFYQLKNKYL